MAGGSLHHLLESQKSLGAAKTLGFTMYNLGKFPAVVAQGSGWVQGEVFFVDPAALRCIDHLEGVHMGLFKRVSRTVQMTASENWVEADIYLLATPVPKMCRVGGISKEVVEVKDGIWHQPKFLLES